MISKTLKKQGGFETDVPLYGEWDEDRLEILLIESKTCKFNFQTKSYYDCLSFEEAARRDKLESFQYTYLFLPRFNFRPSSFEEPVNMYIETPYFKLTPFGTNHDVIRYSKVTIENDIGWIFADIKNDFGLILIEQNKEVHVEGTQSLLSAWIQKLMVFVFFVNF